MFFALSKTVGILATPHYLALLLLGLALLLRLLGKAPRLRRWLVIVTVLELWLLSTGVVANLLLYPLESAHHRPSRAPAKPAAIVMLTGTTDPSRQGGGAGGIDFSEHGDRFVEAVRLAHRHPEALLVIAGGSSAVLDTSYREAPALGKLARELGVPEKQLRIEARSRNTRENAVEVDRLLRRAGIRGPVLLVTSAIHMPRAVGCFEKVGRRVVPWPVDYLRTGWWGSAWLPKPHSLSRSDEALHEYLGWVFYKLLGYL